VISIARRIGIGIVAMPATSWSNLAPPPRMKAFSK